MRRIASIGLIILCTAAGVAPAASTSRWFLNGKFNASPYVINGFDGDGRPHSDSPVVMPPAGTSSVAWPSAIIQPGSSQVLLYASTFDTKWSAVHLFTATDAGGPFTDAGAVFTNDATTEPYGIGPAQVIYEPGAPTPFMMYYIVRGAGGPGQGISLATSVDGMRWSRAGVVLAASLPQESGGLSVSYVCKTLGGLYALFYQGYNSDLSAGYALVATATSPGGPFGMKNVILSPAPSSTILTSYSGTIQGRVAAGATVPLGVPMLVAPGAPDQEPTVAIKQSGPLVWFDHPFLYPHSAAQIVSMTSAKVDPSYAREQPDGSWKGVATVYGPAPGVSAEYTTGVSGPSLSSTWQIDGTGITFSPFGSYGLTSTENPTPLVADDSCAN